MEYKVLSRPKLPRNKYGEVENKDMVGGGGNSYFSSTTNQGSGGSTADINVFVGATNTLDGKKGLVPAPKTNNDEPLITNDKDKFLKGSGAWTDIPISRYTTENINKDGIDLDGNLTVSDTLTTQTLNVLGSAHFWELVIDKVKAAGGNLLITPANFTIDYIGSDITYNVDATQSPFTEMFFSANDETGILGLQELFTANNVSSLKAKRLYQKNSDDNTKIASEFQIGDMVRCKTLNLDENSGFTNKDYWTFILGTGVGTYNDESCMYIDVLYQYVANGTTYGLGTTINLPSSNNTTPSGIDSFKFGYGTFNPEIGDNLVSLGHLWEADRQGAILISSYDPMDTELKAPAIAQYEGINKFTSLSPFRTTSMAANGNNFSGKFMVNYNGNYIDINERLNIFNADLTTGLEKVGIHLDGDNSTIKMVGSVEIKQNSDGVPDTLTVWDDDDIMRVKISPEEIPSLSNIQTSINPTSSKSFNSLSGQYLPTSGSVYYQHSYKYFLWEQWDHQWKYWLDNAYFSYISTMDIGTYAVGQKISVSNLQTYINSRAYFKGTDYVSTRSDTNHTQSISDVILRLKRLDGSSWTTVDTYNLTNTATKTCANESGTISLPNTIIDNYTISTAGTYRLELEIVYNVYATITYTTEQSSPYFTFDYSVRSTVDLVQPSASMTRIGRNGLVFNTDSAGEYFYAGNDGIKLKWGDSEISLSANQGLRTNYKVNTITSSSSKYIQVSDSYVVATSITSNTNIYLPQASEYGIGRIITIVGNDYITVSTNSSSESIYRARGEETSVSTYPSQSSDALTGSRTMAMSNSWTTEAPDGDGGTTTIYHRNHTPVIRLMCTGSGWYTI